MVDRDRTLVEVAERLYFVDVDGTRLVILVGYPPNISVQDRADLNAILTSINIG